MSKSNQQVFPFFPILFLIFLTLKLCGVITWSWWWITAPLWGGFCLIFGTFFLYVVLQALRR